MSRYSGDFRRQTYQPTWLFAGHRSGAGSGIACYGPARGSCSRTKVRSPVLSFPVIALSIAWMALLLCLPGLSRADDEGQWLPTLPEASLAQWYKPDNKRQVWLHTMFALRREMQAVSEYLELEDRARLAKWAERLVGHYRKIPEMVPEWSDDADLDAAVDLERSVAAGDFAAVKEATRELGRSCKSCHREYRALAAARFRAPDFSLLTVTDASGVERDFPDQMHALSRSVNRIKIAGEDQRWDVAELALSKLRLELAALGETCSDCHDDEAPQERILGAEARASLTRIGAGLAERQQQALGRSVGEAAVRICARCHGIHRTLSDLSRRLSPVDRR